MTVPANLAERHYAEQALLAAVVAERKAYRRYMEAPLSDDRTDLLAYNSAEDALEAAMDRYYEAVQAAERKADPVVENIAEAGMFEVHDCPGGAYVITERLPQPVSFGFKPIADDPADPHDAGYIREPHDPDDQFDPADRYDAGYIATPAVADGRAADEFYGKDA